MYLLLGGEGILSESASDIDFRIDVGYTDIRILAVAAEDERLLTDSLYFQMSVTEVKLGASVESSEAGRIVRHNVEYETYLLGAHGASRAVQSSHRTHEFAVRIEIYRALGDIYAGVFIERADEDTVICREI